ncbi:MAG: DUF4445 domain-containing protein [Deltaproteobacteria bacterium]|nr:DUF4445 domain-containing protein [Deltaproteobacteria bacterium]
MKGRVKIRLEPVGRSLRVERGASLHGALAEHGVEFPCGGHGWCRGCRVRVLNGELEQTEDPTEILSPAQLAAGWRLACRARVHDDVTLEIGQWDCVVLADDSAFVFEPRAGLGIAVDVGTTTLVAQLVDFRGGRVLAVRSALNPQIVCGGDVMSRIDAALSGGEQGRLVDVLRGTVGRMVGELVAAAAASGRDLDRVVLAGNTVMQHFFCGRDVAPLATWPFTLAKAGACHLRAGDLGWPVAGDTPVTFLPCLGGFVGSDLLGGLLAIGIHRSEAPCVLIDLGTNGEIVVGNRDRILCASTAAGPAFEGGGIGMGMRATTGAIHRVRAQGGGFHASVLGGGAARGICGSGLVDAAAAALELGLLEPSGRLAGGNSSLTVAEPVAITQRDIRQLQLAKAAVAAGLRILRRRFGTAACAAAPVYLSGAFGNYVDRASASSIGLVAAAGAQVRPAGNTALLGAKIALLGGNSAGYDFDAIRARVEHVALASDPEFEDVYIEEMPFPDPRRR